jgi:urea transport system substrate-binding protein
MKSKGQKKIYLIGSDYVFPRTANKEIKAWAKDNGVTIVGEAYTPLGYTDYETAINKIQAAKPDAVFNTLNGDSNVAFFKQLKAAGNTPEKMQVMSVSIAEEEVAGVGVDNVAGYNTAWNYYQTDPGSANAKFVKDYKAKYGSKRHTDDPIEAGYVSVYLWKAMVEKAGTTNVEAVKKAAAEIEPLQMPEGTVTEDASNHHIWKTARIGVIKDDGLIYLIGGSKKPIKPDPFLTTYPWAKGLSGGGATK